MSVRVDPWSRAGLLGGGFRGLRIAAFAPDCAPLPELASPLGECAKQVIATASFWPDRLWFWLGTAALVATLVALPSKAPSVAAVNTNADWSLAQGPDTPTEARPSGPGNGLFSQANIRFCRFQQVRLEAIGPLTNAHDLSIFRALADDWNVRCARYDYLPSDKRAVDREVVDRREILETEGRSLLSAWRRKIHLGAVPAAPNASSSRRVASNDAIGGMQSLPTLITLGVPGKPEAEPVSWPLLKAPSLALLHPSVAARVQRRLTELGYVISPADGTWASSSRVALRHFKEVNGLLWDDVLDAETVTRLFSTSAVNAPPGPWKRSDSEAAFQTAYPPPSGAAMNPLNRQDAEQIQVRLVELGYHGGSDDGVWGAASRAALRAFKAAHNLSDDDEWDVATEQRLFGAQAVHAAVRAITQDQNIKFGALDTKAEPAAARKAVPIPPKRPLQAPIAARSVGRVVSAATPDRARRFAPVSAAAVYSPHEL